MPRHPQRPVPGSETILEGATGTVLGSLGNSRGDPVARCLAAWMRRIGEGSPSTLRNYKREALAFLDFLSLSYRSGSEGLLNAKPSDCIAFVNAVPGLAPSSRAVKAAVIRGLFGALVLEGLRETNPAQELGIRNVESGKHHIAIPQASIVAVLERLRVCDDPRSIRDRALLLLALAVGARRFELAGLNVGSVERDADGAHITFTGKSRKAARMAIRPGVVAAIDRWLAIAGHGSDPTAALFHSLSRRPDHSGKRLTGDGVHYIVKTYFPKYSPHGLRSRSVTDVWQQSGGNLGHAQAFARHSSPSVTERIYVQAEKLEQAMDYVFDYT